VAYLIDYFIMQFVGFILALPFIGALVFTAIGLGKVNHHNDFSSWTFMGVAGIVGLVLLLVLIEVAAGWLYYALMESSKNRGTLGKMALSLAVTDLKGNRVSFARATGRYFGKIISGMILYIGYILAGVTEKKQALHDMMAGCLVVRK